MNSSQIKYPKKLYKYKAFDNDGYFRDLLEDNMIWFPSRNILDDPFECTIDFDSSSISERELYLYRFNLELTINPSISESDKAGILARIASGNYPAADVDSILSQVTNNMTKIANADYGICSLSSLHPEKGPFNILLWSLYANGHTGFCVEFDTQKLQEYCEGINLSSQDESIIILDKVIYSSKKPVLKSLDNHDIYFDFLRMKSGCWKHQKEWRLIYYKNANKAVQFPNDVIDGIYLGVNCSEDNRNIVKTLVGNRTNKVKVYEASYKPFEYGVRFSQISW